MLFATCRTVSNTSNLLGVLVSKAQTAPCILQKRGFYMRLSNLEFSPQRGCFPWISGKNMTMHRNDYQKPLVIRGNRFLQENMLWRGNDYTNVLKEVARDSTAIQVYNCLAAHWNHDFFWKHMQPNYEKSSEGRFGLTPFMSRMITTHFGSFERFKRLFKVQAMGLPSNGWIWLVSRKGHLDILVTPDNDTPFVLQPHVVPVMGLDMWEHAYFVDYGFDKEAYIDNFWYCVNWRAVEQNMPEDTRFQVKFFDIESDLNVGVHLADHLPMDGMLEDKSEPGDKLFADEVVVEDPEVILRRRAREELNDAPIWSDKDDAKY